MGNEWIDAAKRYGSYFERMSNELKGCGIRDPERIFFAQNKMEVARASAYFTSLAMWGAIAEEPVVVHDPELAIKYALLQPLHKATLEDADHWLDYQPKVHPIPSTNPRFGHLREYTKRGHLLRLLDMTVPVDEDGKTHYRSFCGENEELLEEGFRFCYDQFIPAVIFPGVFDQGWLKEEPQGQCEFTEGLATFDLGQWATAEEVRMALMLHGYQMATAEDIAVDVGDRRHVIPKYYIDDGRQAMQYLGTDFSIPQKEKECAGYVLAKKLEAVA